MKQAIILILTVVCCFAQNEVKNLTGSYLGQKSPGMTPEVFAPGIISLGKHEHDITFSPDGNEIFFVKASQRYTIVSMRNINGIWQQPEIASFSGEYDDMSPRFSPDGKKLFFSSTRPVNGKNDINIWYVEKVGNGWTEPKNIGQPINSDFHELGASVAENGNLYFQYFSTSGLKSDLYFSKYTDGKYLKPEKLPEGINTENNEASPFIAPDESYLLFHSDSPKGNAQMDLFICLKDENGNWGKSINLGTSVNDPVISEGGPIVSPDGKYLFYSTYHGMSEGDIYWIDAKVIEKLKEQK